MFPDITVNRQADLPPVLPLSAARMKIAVVASRFNEHITIPLAQGSVACLQKHGSPIIMSDVLWCPGAFELPLVADQVAARARWDAIICVGAVIRGDTPHFEYVSTEAARGIQEIALRRGLPVIFGVLTTDNDRQARARAGGKHGNKGWNAALAAIEMIDLLQRIKRSKRR